MSFEVTYLPIGVGTYEMNTAEKQFQESKELLLSLEKDIRIPKELLLSVEQVGAFLENQNPDLLILQTITFANAAYTDEVLRQVHCPIVIWTIPELVIDGGRLRSNSLTGAYAAANAMNSHLGEGGFEFVYGGPTESRTKRQLESILRASAVYKKLKSLKLASIGNPPQGFSFGKANDLELSKTFGVRLETVEARELIQLAKSYTEIECQAWLSDAKEKVKGLSAIPEKNQRDFARLYRAYQTFIKEHGIGAIASRCWPDFFTEFKTPVCMVLSLLNGMGIPSSCEADLYGALSMTIASWLAGRSVFFGDPVSLNEKENSICYWHCGMAACDLAREDTGAVVGVHPNRKIGPVMDFACKASKEATVFRLGKASDGHFRFFIAEGEVLDKEKQFQGTSLVVKTDFPAKLLVEKTIRAGFEPHFVVVYKRIGEELERLANMLNVEVVKFS